MVTSQEAKLALLLGQVVRHEAWTAFMARD
jgi:hypothetical protein